MQLQIPCRPYVRQVLTHYAVLGPDQPAPIRLRRNDRIGRFFQYALLCYPIEPLDLSTDEPTDEVPDRAERNEFILFEIAIRPAENLLTEATIEMLSDVLEDLFEWVMLSFVRGSMSRYPSERGAVGLFMKTYAIDNEDYRKIEERLVKLCQRQRERSTKRATEHEKTLKRIKPKVSQLC